jgi:hypothetical protein
LFLPPAKRKGTGTVLHIVPNSGDVKPAFSDDPILAEHAVEIRRLGKRRDIDDVVAIGRHLAEARDHAPGFWLQWLESEFGWSDQTAYRYIHLFEARESSALHKLWSADLPLSALYVLAAPSTPEEACREIAERVEAGEKPTVAEIQETVGKAKKAKTNGAAAEAGGDETADIVVYSDAAHAADGKRAVTASTFGNAVFLACQACENLNDLSPPVLPLERRNKLIAQLSKSAADLSRLQGELMEEEEPTSDRLKALYAAADAVETFFVETTGAEIFARIPSDPDKHKIVVRAFLDALGVEGLLTAMSEKFGRELRERVPQRVIASAIDAAVLAQEVIHQGQENQDRDVGPDQR